MLILSNTGNNDALLRPRGEDFPLDDDQCMCARHAEDSRVRSPEAVLVVLLLL